MTLSRQLQLTTAAAAHLRCLLPTNSAAFCCPAAGLNDADVIRMLLCPDTEARAAVTCNLHPNASACAADPGCMDGRISEDSQPFCLPKNLSDVSYEERSR